MENRPLFEKRPTSQGGAGGDSSCFKGLGSDRIWSASCLPPRHTTGTEVHAIEIGSSRTRQGKPCEALFEPFGLYAQESMRTPQSTKIDAYYDAHELALRLPVPSSIDDVPHIPYQGVIANLMEEAKHRNEKLHVLSVKRENY